MERLAENRRLPNDFIAAGRSTADFLGFLCASLVEKTAVFCGFSGDLGSFGQGSLAEGEELGSNCLRLRRPLARFHT